MSWYEHAVSRPWHANYSGALSSLQGSSRTRAITRFLHENATARLAQQDPFFGAGHAPSHFCAYPRFVLAANPGGGGGGEAGLGFRV